MTWLWLVTAASLVATVLNIHHVRFCFVLWIATNSTWAIVDARAGIHAQAFLHLVYLGLAVYGFHHWRSEPRGTPS